MKALEESVRSISQDGLVWGSSTLIPVGTKARNELWLIAGFGIKKLQITLVVEDDKVSLEELQEKIEEFDDYVQSTDIVYPLVLESMTDFVRLPWLNCEHVASGFHVLAVFVLSQ